MADRASRGRGGKQAAKKGRSSAAAAATPDTPPPASTSAADSEWTPLDFETPPADTSADDAKIEDEEEIFLTAVTPNDITDESCKTFVFKNEGHTLGNSLRFVISHYPEVKFCGHTIPHPSEDEMHLRIQTTPGTSAIDVLRKGLQDLVVVCEHTESAFEEAMTKWTKEHPDKDLFQVPAPPGPKS